MTAQDWASLNDSEIMTRWIDMRESITDMELEEALNTVSKFFAFTPYSKTRIPLFSPKDYPTPWDMIIENDYCPSSISLIMYYTLQLAGFDANVAIVGDGYEEYLITTISNRYVLNYIQNSVDDYEAVMQEVEIKAVFNKEDITEIR